MQPDKNDDHGLWRIEGYLMGHAEVERARSQARSFTDQLPWLTTAQREEVERVYVVERTAAAHAMFQRICDRAAELRAEYAERYLRLKARCVAVTATGTFLLAGVGTLALKLR
ncbi:hypothetical protein [Streptomyces sp. NBC_00448]|uniref:hypothetical protein n=1 Tax=Streptomyces sp. NBC_00448 TaxID=2903652 RepID=UPI002E2113A5